MAKDEIERLAGLKGIRAKSAMYIGPNDSNGLTTIFREPADNCVDLALKGKNKLVHVIFDPNGKGYWVVDAGPGFPVKEKVYEDEQGRKEKMSQFYVATGLTHAGSNFDSDQISRGTHGIGIKTTSAMSLKCVYYTFTEGQWYNIEYRKGKLHQKVTKCKAPKLPHKIKMKKGSAVYFEPELELFQKGSKMQLSDMLEWCKLTSYLVPQIEVQITTAKGKNKVFKTKGVGDYISAALEEKKATQTGKTFVHQDKGVDIALAFTDLESTDLAAYTNGLRNVDGGRHVEAVYDALVKSLKPYKGKLEYKPTDLRDGILGLVNAKLAAPQFSNQRKDGLIDSRAYDLVFDSTLKAFEAFWAKHKSMAKDLVARAAELRKKTADFLKDKKLIKNVKAAGKKMSSKLADTNNKKVPFSDRELFLVEGDSASGTAKKARDKEYQASFALRGKPLNVMDAPKDKVNSNEEVTGILAAIGLGEGKKDQLRYGKIIFLADPDIDGKHINTLLMTIFWKFLPDLYKAGVLYLLHAPEYYTEIGSGSKAQIHFGMTPEEVYEKAGTKKCEVRHIKGWGELDARKMVPMAFKKGSRRLIRLLPPKDKKGAQNFELLMGKKSTYRQQMLGVSE